MCAELPKNSAANIINFLNESSPKLVLSQSKKIILLLGDTGCGKSTLVHFLGKDNGSLKSVPQSDGQYLLIDEDGKISENTTISQTTIPELVEDITSQITFYDCPGFNDTRNTTTDIANAFSIHKIFNHGIEFKIILVINYHSVRSGVDRKSFIELIRNVSNIIKNVRKYSNSIAAVVTKVDNTVFREGNTYNLVPDNQVLNGIAEFLQNVKQEIPRDRSYYENALCLIDIFLMKTQENYDRLAIFRRPDVLGPVQEILLLQNEKNRILNILQNNIVFTTKNITDFGYTISAESQNELIYLVVGINESISSMIYKICENSISAYKTREKNTTELHIQIKAFTIIQKNLLQLEENMRKQMTLLTVISSLRTLFYNMDEEIPQNYFNCLSHYDEQLQFLALVSETNINIKPLEWINGFDELISYVNETKEWYILLDDIFMRLSKYEIQKNKSQFQITEFQSIKTGSDFINKFEIIYDGKLPSYLDIIKNQVDDVKLRMLRNIFIYTLESDIKYITTDPEKVQIRGKYVNISDIPCDILSSTTNFIEIFAVNTIFIDKDLNFEGKKQKIVIAAPEWQVINNRRIILNGEHGIQQSKANNGSTQGEKGKDGKPGLPGGAAGTIFGLGEIFTNLRNLIIEANGGQGGDGQDGGNGVTGECGKNASLPKNFCQKTPPEEQLQSTGFRFAKLTDSEASGILEVLFSGVGHSYYEIFGTDGKQGSNGGDGGYRGEGGPKGKINIIDLKIEPKRLKYNSIDSKNGKKGVGGTGGLGGSNGERIVGNYRYIHPPNVMASVLVPIVGPWLIPVIADNFQGAIWKVSPTKKEYCSGKQNSGVNGINNNNTYGYKEPENSVQIENISNIIDEYKLYLEEYLNDSIKKNHLMEFIEKLNESIYAEIE